MPRRGTIVPGAGASGLPRRAPRRSGHDDAWLLAANLHGRSGRPLEFRGHAQVSYILALDAGTTSVRAILFDRDGRTCGIAQKEVRQIYPRPGWVEHDPEEIGRSQLTAAAGAIERSSAPRETLGTPSVRAAPLRRSRRASGDAETRTGSLPTVR